MHRPCVLPVLPSQVLLWAPDARTVLLVTSIVSASPVVARLTWIFVFHSASLMSCSSSPSSPLSSSVPSFSLSCGTTTPSRWRKFHCQRTTSYSWPSSSSCLFLTSSKTASPNRFVGWHSFLCLLLAQFPIDSSVGNSSPACNASIAR